MNSLEQLSRAKDIRSSVKRAQPLIYSNVESTRVSSHM